MKIAHLILAHAAPAQLSKLIGALDDEHTHMESGPIYSRLSERTSEGCEVFRADLGAG